MVAAAIESASGPMAVAELCGVRRQSVYVWIKEGSLPNTQQIDLSTPGHLSSCGGLLALRDIKILLGLRQWNFR